MQRRPYRSTLRPLLPAAGALAIGFGLWLAPTILRFVDGRPWAWILVAVATIRIASWPTRPRREPPVYVPREWEEEARRDQR